MANNTAPNQNTEKTAPSTSYTVAGSPEDYRYVLRGADLVLIDKNNVEHIFLFVGNIMSLDGRVDMTFSNGATLNSTDLFERSEMVDVEAFYEEEIEWDAQNEADPEKENEGNTPTPDGAESAPANAEAQNAQAKPVENLKQQIMQALKENDNTSQKENDAIRNDNIAAEKNTNTSDKQGGADDIKIEPIVPTLAPPHLALTEDTNSGSNLDSVTNVTTPHFEGTADPGAKLTLYVNDAVVATGKASADGDFLFMPDTSYADGIYSVYVKSEKHGLNAQSSVLPLEIDTIAPDLPSILLATESDTGKSDSDKIIHDSRPILEGLYADGDTSEAGTTLTVEARVQGATNFLAIGTTSVQADGTWSFRLPEGAELADGVYDFQLTAKDMAGNKTASGAAVLNAVEIDTEAPLIGTDLTLDLDSVNPDLTGTDTDFITSDNQFELSGTADNDTTVRVYLGGLLIGETETVSGAWTFAAGAFNFGSMGVVGNSAVLGDGSYDLSVVAFDVAGNESAKVERALVIDTTIDTPDISIDGMVDAIGGIHYISEANPEFTLSGEAYSSGTFSLVDESTGNPVADDIAVLWNPDTDSYTFSSPSTLDNGNYTATFTNMDAAGNEASTSLRFQVESERPPSPLLSVEDTGNLQVSGDPITNNPALTVSFAAGARLEGIQEVRIYLDGNNPPDLDNDTYYVADKQGDSWVLSPTFNLGLRTALNGGYNGTSTDYTYTVVVMDRTGRGDKEIGEAFESTSFTYDTTPPLLDNLDLITDDNDPNFDGIADDYKVDLNDAALSDADRAIVDTVGDPIYVVPVNPSFGGSCEIGCDVTIIFGDDINSDLIQTLRPTTTSWALEFDIAVDDTMIGLVTDKMNKVTIRSTDQAGNFTEEVVYIKVAGEPPAAPSVELVDDYNTGSTDDDITRGLDDGTPADIADDDGLIQLHGVAPGAAYVVITYVDENGDTQTVLTAAGSEHVPVQEGVWQSPSILLTDTSSAHLGTDYTFSVVAYDAANQPSLTSSYTTTIDRATTVPTIDLESDSSGPASSTTMDYGAGLTGTTDDRTSLVVENNVLTLSGTNAEDGSTVWLMHTYNGVTQELNFDEYKDVVLVAGGETGTWSIDLDTTDARILNMGTTYDGEHSFVVRSMDKAGNVVNSAPLTVDFDSTGPVVSDEALVSTGNSSLSQEFVDANSDLAVLDATYADDAVTKTPDFTLTGTLDAEATDEADNVAVRVFMGNYQIGVADVSTDGGGNVSWTYDFVSGLADGLSKDFTFHVDVTDRAGNTTIGNDFVITVDRKPPEISSFELLDSDDSYYDAAVGADDLGTNTDNYTNSSSLTLEGSSDVAAPVLLEYSLDNGASYSALFAIPNGSSAESGINWTQNGSGDWTYTVNVDELRADLGRGGAEKVLFQATASDSAGNTAPESFSVWVDRLAPAGTTIDLNVTSDSVDSIGDSLGELSIGTTDDNRTNADSILLTGTAEAGARVEIYRVNPGANYSDSSQGTLLDVVLADSSTGAWNLTHTFDTNSVGGVDADGEYEFVAVAFDKAGNESSAAMITPHMYRDTVVDASSSLALNAQSNTNSTNPADGGDAVDNPLVSAGTLRVDGEGHTYIDKSFITLNGNLADYDSVADPVAAYVYESGTLLGKATISGDSWSFNVTSLTDGSTYDYTIMLEDSAGNTKESDHLYIKIDASTAPPSLDLFSDDDTSGEYFYRGNADPEIGEKDDITNPDETAANGIDADNAFTLQGSVAEVGSSITLYVAHSLGNGTYSEYEAVTGIVTQPAADGSSWNYVVLDADLTAGDGTYRFKAVAEDLSGNTADQTLNIVVDSHAPSLLNAYELWLDNDSGEQDLKTKGDSLDLHGRLTDTSDHDIVLYIKEAGGEAIKVPSANINWTTGEWSYEYSYEDHGSAGPNLPEDTYSFTLYAEDPAGNLATYPASGTFDVDIDRSLAIPTITLSGDSNLSGGPSALVDANNNGVPDGAEDDYTGYVTANGTDIHLDITADSDSTISVYVKDPDVDVPIDIDELGNPGSGYILCQGGIQYNTTDSKWDTFVFDGDGYQNSTNDVTLVIVADDGSQAKYNTYTFTLDDSDPVLVVDSVTGNLIDWEPANSAATHISDGDVVTNATNGRSIMLSGAIVDDRQGDVTVEIFDSTKSTLEGSFGARVFIGRATINAAGEWVFKAGSDVSPLAEKFHMFTARIEDNAGNFTEVTLDEILVDRSDPVTPTLTMVGTQDTDYTDGLTETGGDGYYLDDRGTPTGLDDVYYNDNPQVEFDLTGLETLPGTVLTVIVDGGTPQETAITSADFTYTPPSNLAEGHHSIEVYVTDAAGNESGRSTMAFVVDTIDPTITQVALDPASNTGSADDATDPVTKIESPEITGHSEANAAISVEVRDDNNTPGSTADDTVYVVTTVADGNGDWSVNVPTIGTGDYAVSVTAIDKAGNVTVEDNVISFEVDRQVDVEGGSFQMVQTDSNDTGFDNQDQYTSNENPSFSWEATEAVTARFVFYKDGNATPFKMVIPDSLELSTDAATGVTTWTPTGLNLAEGNYTVKAVFVDTEAGNETNLNDNVETFTIDRTPTTLTAELATDSGITGDWVTNPGNMNDGSDGSSITFEGSAPSGTTPATEVRVQIFVKNGDGSRGDLHIPTNADVGNDYVNVDATTGRWTYTVASTAFTEGVHNLIFVSTDQAGNERIVGEQSLEIDMTTTAGAVGLAPESNSGTYAEDGDFIDNKTNDTTSRLEGTAEANSTVNLYLGDPDTGTLIGRNISTDADGNWYFDVDTDARVDSNGDPLLQNTLTMTDASANLNGTSYSFTAEVTDRANNVAQATGTIVVDTQAPDESDAYGRILPTPTTVGMQTVYSDTGVDHTDGYTSNTQPTLIGEVPEGHSRVDVYITYPGDAEPTLIGTTKADVNGTWQLEFPNDATALAGSTLGTDYEVSVKTWDDAGNETPDFSPSTTITIDTSVGDADGDLDDDLAGDQPARIRFGAAFDAANPPSGDADPVTYDESDHTLKSNLTEPVFDITLEPDCDTVTLTLIKQDEDGNPVSNPVLDTDMFVINLGPSYAENPPEDGNWTGVIFKTVAGVRATINGDWLLMLSGTDKAGNEFSLDGGQPLIVNGIPPEFTMTIDEDHGGDTGQGLYEGDNIINAGTVHFTGTFGDEVDWREISDIRIIHSVDNSVVASLDAADITGPTWTMEALSVIDGGATSHSLYVRALDNFGNEFWYPSATEPLTYIVDRTVPVLNESSVDLVAGDDSSGIFHATNADDETTVRTPHIEFSSEDSSKVELLLEGVLKFTAMPPDPSDGGAGYTYALDNDALTGTLPVGVTYDADTKKYSYTSDSLIDGDYTFTVRATDLAGNVSTRDLVITIDNEYNNEDLTGDLSSSSDGGEFGDNVASHDDNLSNDVAPELSGSAESGSAVRIYLQRFDTKAAAEADTDFAVGDADWDYDGQDHEIVLGDSETSWSWDATQADGSELTDGYYKVIVVSEDQAGNSPDPEVFIFGKDTDSPSEPVADDPGDVPLSFHLHDTIEDVDLDNEGSADAGEVQQGDFLDAAGNNIWVTSNWMPTIGGNAEFGSRVSVILKIDGDLDGNLDDPSAIYKNLTIDVTDPAGAWSFDFAGEQTGAGRLADGIYTATVTCTDPAGNTTTMDPSPQFQINSIPPSPPTIRLDQDDDSYDAQTFNDGITNKDTGLTLKGTAEAGATVRLYRSAIRAEAYDLIDETFLAANIIVTLTANASGEWSYEIPTDSGSGDPDTSVVEDGSYRYFVAGDYFNGNTYYSLQATNSDGQALINADGSPILQQPIPILDDNDDATGEYTYSDYIMEVDTELADPTFELGLILDTTSGGTEEERQANSSRMDSGIDNEWRTPEEVAAGVYLGDPADFWKTSAELAGEGTYDDWRVKTSGPTIEGIVEAGSIVYVERYMLADLTDGDGDNPIEQWVRVGIVDQDSTTEGTWRFVFPAEYENAEYQVRIRVVDKAGNEYESESKTIYIDAEIEDTVLDLTDDQDTVLPWTGVAAGTAWADIAGTATLAGLDYVQKSHLPTEFESGNSDDLTTENNLLLHGEVEVGSRLYLTDTRQGVTVPITPVLVLDPATMLGDNSATEAYYVKIDDVGDVGTWAWKSAAQFSTDHGADYDGIYFHINNDGTWEYQTGELEDVKHAYTIENIDLAGNLAVTTPLAVDIDHDFSGAGIGLSTSSDTGPFGNNDPAYDDRITSDGTPAFRLYGDSGATYLVYAYHINVDGTVGDNVNADGTPMVTGVYGEAADTYETLDLDDGGYQLRLVNISESGHVSEAIYPPTEADGTYVTSDGWDERASIHPLVIDTVDPEIRDLVAEGTAGYHVHMEDGTPGDPTDAWTQPVTNNGRTLPIIISGDAADVDGDGVISADLITTDNTPTIQVFVEPGTMIAVSGMGYSSYFTDTDNDGIIELNPSTDRNSGNPYTNGTYNMQVRFGDIAGNISDEAHPMQFSVVIDANGPYATIVLEDASDTGTSTSDNLTNDTTPTLSGRVSADALRYEITIGGTTIERHIGDADYGTLVTVDGADYYDWSYTSTLGNGDYNVSIAAWDRAGNMETDGLNAHHPDDPNTVTNNVPLIIHQTGELPLYAGCEENRSGTRLYLDIDYSVSDAYNDPSNNYAGPNRLFFTYKYDNAPDSHEIVQMELGETDFSQSIVNDPHLTSLEFYMEDSAGNTSGVGVVDLTSDPADGVYTVENIGGLEDIPETADVEFTLSGSLQDDNLGDSLAASDVETVRATITGDIDGDGTMESLTQDVAVANDGTWAMNFSHDLATGDFDLDVSALSADGSTVTLASVDYLNYDFSVLQESALAQPDDSQVLFAADSSAPEPPAPATVDTITIEIGSVVIEDPTL
ncbi:MAG: Ig-like domain repeat protein [Pseudodesulfovibrio sp.]|nr:Ig-like domain repeat protein [Pseudodesulfovibrio sp.]